MVESSLVPWLARGWLRSQEGQKRYVPGLDVIGKDMQTLAPGVPVHWNDPVTYKGKDVIAVARLDYPEIVIAPRLFRQVDWWIRRILSHELGHMVTDSLDEDEVRVWQAERYGDLVTAPV
jgi:hypothetical protein